MKDDILGAATAALRAESDRDTGMAPEATRFRLRRSLDERARTRRRASVVGLVFAILFGSTVTWAWSTGRVQSAWRAVTGPAPTPVAHAIARVAPPPARPAPTPALAVEVAPAPAVPAPDPIAVVPPVAPRAKPRRAEASAPPVVASEVAAPAAPDVPVTPAPPEEAAQSPEVEALYRKAHEAHFRGSDPGRALAAWDAYLAAEPSGRFLVEAKYNRAIVLVKLARYDEAKAALGPFARGEVKPAGYRQAEATALIDRIAALNGSNGSGH